VQGERKEKLRTEEEALADEDHEARLKEVDRDCVGCKRSVSGRVHGE
jgi:hypothetical protein